MVIAKSNVRPIDNSLGNAEKLWLHEKSNMPVIKLRISKGIRSCVFRAFNAYIVTVFEYQIDTKFAI